MVKQLWIVGLLILVQAGCSASQPSWVNKPVSDSQQSFYSAGSGPTVEMAKQNALNNLASRLIVNVENETSTRITKEQNNITSSYHSDSVFKTEALDFFKVEVAKSTVIGTTQHVLISANKQQVFAAIQAKLETNLQPLLQIELTHDAQVLANGIKLDRIYPRYQKYLSLLKAYQQPTGFIELPLGQFHRAYTELKSETSFNLISGADPLSITVRLSERLNSAGYFQGQRANRLDVYLVGPEIQYSEQNHHHSYMASGELIYSFNGEVILTEAIKAFAYATSQAQALSELTQKVKLELQGIN